MAAPGGLTGLPGVPALGREGAHGLLFPPLGRLLAAAILLTLTWQAAAYVIQMLVGLLGYQGLLTSFPYPLLSDGGTALAVDCALLGLLASVFRNGSIVREDSRGRSYIPRETT